MMFPFPIIIFSCKRPAYLELVLKSLAIQTLEVNKSCVYLYIDRIKDESTADDLISNQIKLFSKYFDGENVFVSDENMGIGGIRYLAEIRFFLERKNKWVLFLEDDLELSPVYLEMLMEMKSNAFDSEKVSQVAAFGNIGVKQYEFNPSICMLAHSWGALTSGKYWKIIEPVLDVYTNLILQFGYKNRPSNQIRKIYMEIGISWYFETELESLTSQDNLRSALYLYAGGIRLNTVNSYAKYIGIDGDNFNDKIYEQLGYLDQEISEEFAFITPISNSSYYHSVTSSTNYLKQSFLKTIKEKNLYELNNVLDQSVQLGWHESLVSAVNKYQNLRLKNLINQEALVCVADEYESIHSLSVSYKDLAKLLALQDSMLTLTKFVIIINNLIQLEFITRNITSSIICRADILVDIKNVDISSEIELILKKVGPVGDEYWDLLAFQYSKNSGNKEYVHYVLSRLDKLN